MSNYTHHNESELIRQFADGDPAAFKDIYDRYFISVFYFALRFVSNKQEAEDITTETFVKCWQKHGDFANIHKLTSFLYVTTRNACINILREEKRQTKHQQQLIYLLSYDDVDAKSRQQQTAVIYQYIYEEIEKLPTQEKYIFKMAYIDGLSNEEIASRLGINNQSVRNSKHRALKTMRLALADKDIYKLVLLLMLCPN